MRIFHELAFDGYIVQGQGFSFFRPYSHPRLHRMMGAVDLLSVGGYATQVSGTAPTLQISIECSNDLHIWYQVIQAGGVISLSTSGETLFQGVGVDAATTATFSFSRFNLYVGGTNAAGYFRVWVTGRDRSRRAGAIIQAGVRRERRGTNAVRRVVVSRTGASAEQGDPKRLNRGIVRKRGI